MPTLNERRRWPTGRPSRRWRRAEEHGIDQFPLYAWTKTTIENPAKKEKYLKSFTLHVKGQEVYDKAAAGALEADLKPLAEAGSSPG